jgi:hypothetical protein
MSFEECREEALSYLLGGSSEALHQWKPDKRGQTAERLPSRAKRDGLVLSAQDRARTEDEAEPTTF